MTDNEIIRDLFRCANKDVSFCKECRYRYYGEECCIQLMKDALDLINRQNVEIKDERAKGKMCAEVIARQDKELEYLREIVFTDRTEAIKNLKYEAIKEFAERLIETLEGEYIKATNPLENAQNIVVSTNIKIVDSLVKEMIQGE